MFGAGEIQKELAISVIALCEDAKLIAREIELCW